MFAFRRNNQIPEENETKRCANFLLKARYSHVFGRSRMLASYYQGDKSGQIFAAVIKNNFYFNSSTVSNVQFSLLFLFQFSPTRVYLLNLEHGVNFSRISAM